MASCAIPSWYAPVVIDGRSYVDGGTRSPTSVDLLTDAGLDEVLVLAPACSFALDQPRGALARIERQMRRWATRVVVREVALLRAAGTKVTVICPGPRDLEVIGGNVMDLTRRREVFETSLQTSAAALALPDAAGGPLAAAG
jgi:NTE family protein